MLRKLSKVGSVTVITCCAFLWGSICWSYPSFAASDCYGCKQQAIAKDAGNIESTTKDKHINPDVMIQQLPKLSEIVKLIKDDLKRNKEFEAIDFDSLDPEAIIAEVLGAYATVLNRNYGVTTFPVKEKMTQAEFLGSYLTTLSDPAHETILMSIEPERAQLATAVLQELGIDTDLSDPEQQPLYAKKAPAVTTEDLLVFIKRLIVITAQCFLFGYICIFDIIHLGWDLYRWLKPAAAQASIAEE